MSRRATCQWCLLFLLILTRLSRADDAVLPQQPTLSSVNIVFVHGGQLWIVPRQGGAAHLLTSGAGIKYDPAFSPDGSKVAFTGKYNGSVDVYVIGSDGSGLRRLTHHPAMNRVVGWSPDGSQVLFRSARESYSFFDRLFSVSLAGGLPQRLPLPMAEAGSFSADGRSIAYVPVDNQGRKSLIAWRHYRGGKTSRIWIVSLSNLQFEPIPQDGWNDSKPMWIRDKVYYLSDRSGVTTIYDYDIHTHKVEAVLKDAQRDILSASAAGDSIVYEELGSLYLLDTQTRRSAPVDIRLGSDSPDVHPYAKSVAHEIRSAHLSASGARAVMEAHGEIFTVPAQNGDTRNITDTPGIMERDPAWSPDGKWIAYFSDASGEYQLFLQRSDRAEPPVRITLGPQPSFYFQPVWSPDSSKVAYSDKGLNLWYVDIVGKHPVRVDSDAYETPEQTFNPSWSPDSRWIAYTKNLFNHLHAVCLYSLADARVNQVTDGSTDARYPAFDKSGLYLYFTASADQGAVAAWLDLSSVNRTVTRNAYLIVLRKTTPSPLAPASDEEAVTEASTADAAKGAPTQSAGASQRTPAENVIIDFDGLNQRILSLPMPVKNISGLVAGEAGTIFLTESASISGHEPAEENLWAYHLRARAAENIVEGISYFTISNDGSRILYIRGRNFVVAAASMHHGERGSVLDLSEMQVRIDPRAEWKQEFEEALRIQRDFYYDPHFHGVDLSAVRQRYVGYLDAVDSRSDLSYLLSNMLSELGTGHITVSIPESNASTPERVGLLGADYIITNNRYRFARIYQGENWDAGLRAPLTEPGVDVKEGDYLLAVNGRNLNGRDEIYERFEGLADKSVSLTIASSADGKNLREVTVEPTDDESSLRNLAWVNENRRAVDRLSGGRVAYIYVPDTSTAGYAAFNRDFYGQVGREGAVIDERFNEGGSAPDYFIDQLRRPLVNYWTTREGRDFTTPEGAIFGPKALVTNMFAGSGGDALAWYFRESRLGPLVGDRTWGGMIGVYDTPRLMDGEVIDAPRIAPYTVRGAWAAENAGVPPDYPVEITPRDWASGRDPQIEKAVSLLLDTLRHVPPVVAQRPAYPSGQSGPTDSVIIDPPAATASMGLARK